MGSYNFQSNSRSSDKGDFQSDGDEWMGEDEPGPADPSRAAFELHREGCVCVVNVTVPATEASSTVVETKCVTELAKDLAIGPGTRRRGAGGFGPGGGGGMLPRVEAAADAATSGLAEAAAEAAT